MFSTVDHVGLELLGPRITDQPAGSPNHLGIHYLYSNHLDFRVDAGI
ncbi:MAG: hypothetical protein CM15mP65_05920 [Crocinitomicaceae bacterium]|nr:MAG: hypothetical protein CM15mP65_05920 [Crocinitomicaceae bacterium]